jgi:hypothetical protein
VHVRFWVLASFGLLGTTLPVLGQTSTPRPAVTYSLVRNDDGTGTHQPGNWAVYADVTSPGYSGIFAFGVDFVDGSVTSIRNLSPRGVFYESAEIDPLRPIGFTAVRTTDLVRSKFSGSQELINPDAVIEYGFGLRDGRLDEAADRPVVNALGQTGTWTLENQVQNSYRGHLLLAAGKFDDVQPEFQFDSPDNVVGVFLASNDRRLQRADMTLLTRDLLPFVDPHGAAIPEPATAAIFPLLAAAMLVRRVRRLPTH